MTKIKLCGMTKPESIICLNRIKPDFAGFVFAEKSKRYVTRETARELSLMLDKDITLVGVFVDSPAEEIEELFREGTIKIAQLHGHEPDELIVRLQEDGIPVIRAFKVRSAEDIEAARRSPADWVLLDSGAGSGKTFDWSLIQTIDRPYFLAGGLTPGNVRGAVEELHPYAVDASSSLETDGQKDEKKMADFVNEVRDI
ncbi:MAG: phosphoribosylanthranilate isomerase [Ruminococcus sp.]|nr:phosphoribosylanthranilate isomerase [Ruminococcus sp.]